MAVFKIDKEKAAKAGSGKFIDASGWYVGELTKAVFGKKDSGVKYLEVAFEDESGMKTDFLQLKLTNKDGSENFEAQHVHALLGILDIEEAQVVVDKDGTGTLPAICNKKIGIGLQKEHYINGKKENKYTFRILHFVDAQTKKTFAESESLKDAKTWGRPITDKQQKDECPF